MQPFYNCFKSKESNELNELQLFHLLCIYNTYVRNNELRETNENEINRSKHFVQWNIRFVRIYLFKFSLFPLKWKRKQM